MTFLPIVERELRAAARQPFTHRMRWIAAALALVIWFALGVVGGNLTPSQRATAIFGTISILSLGFAMLAGVFLTADCLSEERREGTLGLLFLTDLKGYDVVFGKLASTSLHSIYGLLAVVPMLAIPLLMGGVTAGEFMRTALVLLVTLFLSLSAGMFVSALSHDSRAAILRTFAAMVLVSGLMPMVWWASRLFFRLSFDFLLWPSPGYALRCAGDAFYSSRGGMIEFWLSLSVIGGLGMLLLIVASVMLPRVWRQAGDETDGMQSKRTKPAKTRCAVASRVWLESKPFYWLSVRDDRMGRWAKWTLGAAFLVWLCVFCGVWVSSRPMRSSCFTITLFLTFGLHVIFKCMVAAEATRRLSEDRQSGALELLLVTPLPPADIIQGQRQALRHLFRWPMMALVLMNLLLLWQIAWPDPLGVGHTEQPMFVTVLIGGIALLFADCFAIESTGIRSALTTRRHTRAILKTLRNVLLPSWLGMLVLWFVGMTSGGISSNTVIVMIVVWVGFGLMVDGHVWVISSRGLRSGFRELVATGKTRVTTSAPVELP